MEECSMEQGIVPNNVIPDRWLFSSAVPGLHGLEVLLRAIGPSLQRVSFLQDSFHNMSRCGHTDKYDTFLQGVKGIL